MNELRVALFSGNYNATKDGAAVALNRLVAFLENQGVEVLVFSPTVARPAMEAAGTLISVPSIALPGRAEYRVALGLPRSCRKRLEAFRPTLFHLSAPDLLGYAALRLARRWGVPAVASFHTRFDTYARYYGAAWLEKYLTAYLRHFYRHCVHVYVPSESTAAELREQNIGHDLRIWSRGVDCTLFHPGKRDLAWRRSLGIGDDEVVISFAARLVREKGLGTFAEAVAALRRRGVPHRAMVMGDGPERQWMQSQMPDAIFTGFLSGEALARGYASSDVFFFPSVTETFGIVTLEAMASGVPPVCANATGSSSLITQGVTGFLAAPEGGTEFVDYLTRLVTDGDLRRRMSTACAERAQAYDWDTAMRSVLSNYREVVNSRRISLNTEKPSSEPSLGRSPIQT